MPITPPAQCHLWRKDELLQSDLGLTSAFAVRKTYAEESHFIRRLLQCRDCGQLYFYEFTEEIDWQAGNDPQNRLWVPVSSEEEADRISQLAPIDLLRLTPRIQSNWPKEAQAPITKWVGK